MVQNHLTVSEQAFSELQGDDAALLIASRFRALRIGGCEPEDALIVAVHSEVSVPRAAALIRHGVSPGTVLRLLTPEDAPRLS